MHTVPPHAGRDRYFAWRRGLRTVAVVTVTVAMMQVSSRPLPSPAPLLPFPALLVSSSGILALAVLGVPDRWLPNRRLFLTLSKWVRLVVVPAAAMVVAGHPHLPLPSDGRPTGVLALWAALIGTAVWCVLELRGRSWRLLGLLGWARTARLGTEEFAFQLLHNGLPEEFFFRLTLQSSLTGWLGAGWGIGAASLIFGLSHILQPSERPLLTALRDAILVQAPLGALLGVLWQHTASLPAIALCHACIDTAVGLGGAAARHLSLRARHRAPLASTRTGDECE